MALVKFGYGLTSNYTGEAGLLYFSTDGENIIFNNKEYSPSKETLDKLKLGVNKVELDADLKTLIFTIFDDSTFNVELKEVTDTLSGLMTPEDKVILDTLAGDDTVEGSLANTEKRLTLSVDDSLDINPTDEGTELKVKLKEDDNALKLDTGGLYVDTSALTTYEGVDSIVIGDEEDGVRKISLKLDGTTLSQSEDGLKCELFIKKLDDTGDEELAASYLIQDAEGNVYGDTINLAKDLHLKEVYVDLIPEGKPHAGDDALILTWFVADGSETTVYIRLADILEGSAVTWTDVSTVKDPNRKSIVLDNHDLLLGKGGNCLPGLSWGYEGGEDLSTEAFNLAMISKWNVADFGSNKIHLNLNSKDVPTWNDDTKLVVETDLESYVPWTDVSTPLNPDRKTIALANHDLLVGFGANCEEGQPNGYEGGENLEGGSFNLAMVSKWNVADYGSTKIHLNLNSKDRPTINDDNKILIESDLKLSEDYEKSAKHGADLKLEAGDTYEEAFSKVHKALTDNELVTYKVITTLNKQLGFNNDLLFEPSGTELQGKDVTEAIDYILAKVKTVGSAEVIADILEAIQKLQESIEDMQDTNDWFEGD